MQQVTEDAFEWSGGRFRFFEAAEKLALAVASVSDRLDDDISQAADNWRWDRVGVIEKNILRLALYELEEGEVPPRVTISEAVKLAHWFAGSKAPSFVNGVLDGLAHDRGYL